MIVLKGNRGGLLFVFHQGYDGCANEGNFPNKATQIWGRQNVFLLCGCNSPPLLLFIWLEAEDEKLDECLGTRFLSAMFIPLILLLFLIFFLALRSRMSNSIFAFICVHAPHVFGIFSLFEFIAPVANEKMINRRFVTVCFIWSHNYF